MPRRPADTAAGGSGLRGFFIISHCGSPVIRSFITALRITARLFEIAKLKERLVPDSIERLIIVSGLEAGGARVARQTVANRARSLCQFALAQ